MESFKPGDEVYHKAGSVTMIVEKVDGDNITCSWMDDATKPRRETYPAAVLTKKDTYPFGAV